tara:strand:- start:148 stop:1518 length:1371 start_codon:yes stop_codon:yes gene_type:complete
MALPTLTPKQNASKTILPEKTEISGLSASEREAMVKSFPFGTYANEEYWFDASGAVDSTQVDLFLSGSADQVAYTYRKLGGDVLDIELTKEQVYSAYEEACLEYSYLINIHQSKNVLSNVLGGTTGSFNEDGMITETSGSNGSMDQTVHLSLRYPRFDFAYARRVTDGISEEAQVGGSNQVYSASFDITADVQDYNLQEIITQETAAAGGVGWRSILGLEASPNTDAPKILIKKVYFKTPKTMWNYYGYYGGVNVMGNLSTYGQYADDSTYEVVPMWQNKLQAKAFEESLYVRASHSSYELKNNRLRLFPTPGDTTPDKMWIEFVVPSDTWVEDSKAAEGITGINNLNTIPLQNIPYKNINSIGKQWIRRFALALSKEMLGLIRSKFASIPIPGNDISMNGDALVSAGKEEQSALRDELKETLDELTYSKMMEGDAETVENSNAVMQKVPTGIFTG